VTLARRERRLLALGLLVLALVLVWLAIVRPILGGFDAREEEREQLLTSYARGERVIGAMRATRAALRVQRAGTADWALDAPSPALATDILRETVLNAARASHATVASVQEAQAPAGTVAVRADLTTTPDKLGPLLVALQNIRPWPVVEQFNVVADRSLEAPTGAPVDVRVDLSVRFNATRPAR
jgi:hypothetical protein